MQEYVLWKYMKKHAKEKSESIAIISGEEKISYKEIDRISDNLALALIKYDIGKGDIIATLLPPSKEFVFIYVAAAKISAVLLPLDLREKPPEMISKCNEMNVKLFITLSNFLDIDIYSQMVKLGDLTPTIKHFIIARGLPPDAPEKFISMEEIIENNAGKNGRIHEVMTQVSPEDNFVIIYTGGTTGTPKGVLHSQGACIYGDLGLIDALKLEGENKVMFHLPVSHVGGLDILLSTMLMGGILVVLEYLTPKDTLKLIQEQKITFFGGVPTLFRMLLMYENFDQYDLSSIKTMVIAAEPIPPELNKKIREKFPSASLSIGYGLTEAGAGWVGIQRPDDPEDKKLYSVGRPARGIETKIVDFEGRELPPGEEGEIYVKGPPIMKTYVQKERNKEAFSEDGWLITGDIGKKDKEGYLYLVGRKKNMIKVKGFAVYPPKIEEYIENHPEIQLSAVIGVPHEVYGEVVMVFVVLKEGATLKENEILQYCKEGLPDYEVPHKIVIKESLPLTRIGKVDKLKLQDKSL